LRALPAQAVTVGGRTCDIQRDKYGKIARSKKVVSDFRKSVPCPATGQVAKRCPDYVIDHVTPLCACGADAVSNLQWQTVADAKVKDRWERKICGGRGD
jgi:hypothetical protein